MNTKLNKSSGGREGGPEGTRKFILEEEKVNFFMIMTFANHSS